MVEKSYGWRNKFEWYKKSTFRAALKVLLAPLNRRNDENFEKNPFSGKKKGRIMNPLATIATDFEELKERRYMYTYMYKDKKWNG